jgi:hypothetical protein
MLLHATNLYSATGTLVVLLGLLVLARYLVRALASPLRDLPGPPLARFTRLWELYNNYQGHLEHVMIALHKRYGISTDPYDDHTILTSSRPHRPSRSKPLQYQ